MSTVETAPPAAAPARRRGGVRSIAAGLIVAIAAVLLGPALIGYWGHRTVTDAERYIETVGPLAYSPEIQEALAQTVGNAIVTQVDSKAFVEQIFAGIIDQWPQAEALVGPLSAAIDVAIRSAVDKLVKSQAFADIWITLNKIAQQGLMKVLEGGSGGPVTIEGDQVVLDTSVVIAAVKQDLVDRGFGFLANIDIKVNAPKIVLLTSPQVAQLRTIYSFSAPVMMWSIIITVLLFAAGILLARRRARMVAIVGVVVTVVMAILAIGLRVAEGAFENAFADTPFAFASTAFWTQLISYLSDSIGALLTLGIILVLAGWVAGSSKPATEVRGAASGAAGSVAARIPSTAAVAPHMRRRIRLWRGLAIAIPVLVLVLVGTYTAAAVLVAAAAALVLLTLVEILASGAGAGRSAQPA